jgi:hypothetical protein
LGCQQKKFAFCYKNKNGGEKIKRLNKTSGTAYTYFQLRDIKDTVSELDRYIYN